MIRTSTDGSVTTLLLDAPERKNAFDEDMLRKLSDALVANPPSGKKGRNLKVLYATQPSARPPTFVLFANDPQLLHFSYRRYLENRLREAFELEGTPVRIVARRRQKGKEGETIH